MSLFRKKPEPTLPPSKPNLPHEPVVYPAGTAVVAPSGKFLINRDGKKYRFTSDAIFNSWDFPLVVVTSDVAISKYPTAVTKMKFRDGTLLNNIADGRLYLVSEGVLRHITNPIWLETLHKRYGSASVVSQADIDIMRIGEELG